MLDHEVKTLIRFVSPPGDRRGVRTDEIVLIRSMTIGRAQELGLEPGSLARSLGGMIKALRNVR